MISSRMLPEGATPSLEMGRTFKTIAGNFFSGRSVSLSDIVMPEFDKTRKIDGIKAFVFGKPCAYDIVLSQDFLHKTGINVLLSRGIVTWLDKAIPMKKPADLSLHFLDNDEDDFRDDKEYEDAFISEILDAKYEKTTTAKVAEQ
jgi:hypothetical protein